MPNNISIIVLKYMKILSFVFGEVSYNFCTRPLTALDIICKGSGTFMDYPKS